MTTRTWHNIPYFKDKQNCLILLDSIRKYRCKYKFKLFGYCLMPDHLHLLIQPGFVFDNHADGVKPLAYRKDVNSFNGIKPSANQKIEILSNQGTRIFSVDQVSRLGDGFTPSPIEDIIHDIKGKTAFDIRKRSLISEKIWQKSFYDFPVYSEEKFEQKLNYIKS